MSLLVLFLALIAPGLCKQVSGSLHVKEQWHYFDKFCFSNAQFGNTDPNHPLTGRLEWQITTTNDDLWIVLYLGDNDRNGSWSKAYEKYKEGLNCTELVKLHYFPPKHSGQFKVVSGKSDYFAVHDVVRPYWWYIALADCSTQAKVAGGINVSHFKLNFTNPAPDNALAIWYREFSYDIQGLGQAYIVFTMFYFGLSLAHLYAVWQLVRSEEYHPLIKLVTAGLLFLFFSVFFYMIHFSLYSADGRGSPGLEGFAMALTMISQLVMMFVCIMVSKGWTITYTYLSQANLIKLFMALISLGYLGLIIWDNVGRDPASTTYFYDSPIGIVVILLRLALAGWFCWNLVQVLKVETNDAKRKFYTTFGILFFLWFTLLPFMVLIALALQPWYRERTVDGISIAIDAFGYASLVYLLWPSRITNYFNVSNVVNQSLLPEDHARSQHDTL